MNAIRTVLTICACAATVAAQNSMTVEGLPDDAPLRIAAKASAKQLDVNVSMNPEWHLYAKDVGGGQPVSVTIEKRSHFAAAGPLVVPAGEAGKLKGSFTLRLPLKKNAKGERIAARFEFMACDPLQCLAPMSVSISGRVGAGGAKLKILVVVDKEDARSKRVCDLLKRHGLTTTVTTYKSVDVKECNAHDVVLADSKLFRENERGSRSLAIAFPKTRKPVVAVGFLGTELIEAHKIAMTSGYI